MGAVRASPLDRRPHAARESQVIVLDEHTVVEPHTVIAAAAHPHRVFLERAQAGCGFPSVEELALQPRQLLLEQTSQRSDAAQVLDKIQCHTFSGKQCGCRAAGFRDRAARLNERSLFGQDPEVRRPLEFAKDRRRDPQPRHNRFLLADESSARAGAGLDGPFRGQVACAQVFRERAAHQLAQLFRRQAERVRGRWHDGSIGASAHGLLQWPQGFFNLSDELCQHRAPLGDGAHDLLRRAVKEFGVIKLRLNRLQLVLGPDLFLQQARTLGLAVNGFLSEQAQVERRGNGNDAGTGRHAAPLEVHGLEARQAQNCLLMIAAKLEHPQVDPLPPLVALGVGE